ncbi:hypothetical protein YC2023_079359 [Brassica napus]|nr:unnamed protein product [Brassica napus]
MSSDLYASGVFECLYPLYYYHQKHPVNYLLLGLFTLALAFVVGLTCAFTNGKVILQSAILDKYLYNNPETTLDWKQMSKIVKGVVGVLFCQVWWRHPRVLRFSVWTCFFAFGETRAMAIANLGCDGYDLEEVEMVFKLGLLCSHSDPRARPSMRLVLQYLRGDMSLPELTPLDLSAGNGMNLGGREEFSGIAMSYSSSVFNGFTGVSSITDSLLLVGESAILTTVVVLSLTVYTFWAAKRGYDFNFLGPLLFGALIVLIIFAMIQVTPLTPNSMP